MARYLGIRPHVEAAARSTGAEPLKVEKIDPIKRLNNLLCQAGPYIDRKEHATAKGIVEAARKHLAELDAAQVAGRAAFAEVEGLLGEIAPAAVVTETPSPVQQPNRPRR